VPKTPRTPDPYRIFLVRHAIAGERGPQFPDDRKRPLTPEGIGKFRKVARGLAALEPEIEIILTSPLVRAVQTAELMAQYLPGHPAVVTTDALAPRTSYADVLAMLSQHTKRSGLALVGHEPGLGVVAARLVGGRRAFALKKGGVCRVDVDSLPPAAPGRLVWFLPPKVLTQVG
jgi:phosphohistidine phosphatase